MLLWFAIHTGLFLSLVLSLLIFQIIIEVRMGSAYGSVLGHFLENYIFFIFDFFLGICLIFVDFSLGFSFGHWFILVLDDFAWQVFWRCFQNSNTTCSQNWRFTNIYISNLHFSKWWTNLVMRFSVASFISNTNIFWKIINTRAFLKVNDFDNLFSKKRSVNGIWFS